MAEPDEHADGRVGADAAAAQPARRAEVLREALAGRRERIAAEHEVAVGWGHRVERSEDFRSVDVAVAVDAAGCRGFATQCNRHAVGDRRMGAIGERVDVTVRLNAVHDHGLDLVKRTAENGPCSYEHSIVVVSAVTGVACVGRIVAHQTGGCRFARTLTSRPLHRLALLPQKPVVDHSVHERDQECRDERELDRCRPSVRREPGSADPTRRTTRRTARTLESEGVHRVGFMRVGRRRVVGSVHFGEMRAVLESVTTHSAEFQGSRKI